MSFLSDAEIEALIASGAIQGVEIRYADATPDRPSQVQPCSLDIRVEDIYPPLLSPQAVPLRTSSHSVGVGESVRVSTTEVFELPPDIGGILMAPARITRRGVLIPDLGHIDPGFKGSLRMTLINLGREADLLSKGDVVGTVLLFRLMRPAAKPFDVQPGSEKHLDHGVTDVKYLSPDFLDFKKRATSCARAEAKKVVGASGFKLFLHWTLPVLFGVGSAYLLYIFAVEARLTKAEAQFEATQKLIDVERRLGQLEARNQASAAKKPASE